VRTPNETAIEMIKFIMEEKEMKQKIYNIDEVKNKMDEDNKGPYQNVFLQEIEYMNNLMNEMTRSLDELDQGFKGLLTISDQMEALINSIFYNKVPATW
jgi:dynein heavy chain